MGMEMHVINKRGCYDTIKGKGRGVVTENKFEDMKSGKKGKGNVTKVL